jgi:hypothetical protein
VERSLASIPPPAQGWPETQDGLVFDSVSTRGYTGDGNWDITVEPHDTLPPPRHYDLGYTLITFGAECGLHDVVDGISARVKVDSSVLNLPHSIKCKNGDSRIGFPTPGTGAESTIHYLSKTTSSGTPIDDRCWPSVGWDSDVGFVKAECIFGQVVTGVGQTEDDEIDAIACAPSGYVNTNNCRPPSCLLSGTLVTCHRIGRTATSRPSAASASTSST